MDSPLSTYTFKKSSTLVLIGSHTHGWAGGEKISVYLNGGLLEEFHSVRKDEHPWSWATPSALTNLHVRAGDTISFTATYSNLHDQPLLHEAMGMVVIAFAPDQ